jgi:hypothetical protein
MGGCLRRLIRDGSIVAIGIRIAIGFTVRLDTFSAAADLPERRVAVDFDFLR